MLDGLEVSWRGHGSGNPAIIGTQFGPIGRGHLAGEGAGAMTATAFGQALPLMAEGIVDVIVPTKTRIGAQNRPLALGWREQQALIQGFEDRDVSWTAMLLTGI